MPGDRVRVTVGDHEGRAGVLADPARKIAQLRAALLHSPVRDLLEMKRIPAEGSFLVDLEATPWCHSRTVSLPADHLIRVVP